MNVILLPAGYLVLATRNIAIIVPIITVPICLYVGSKILENKLLSNELERLVNRDRLTNVATRDFFFTRMGDLPDAYGVSLMVDIDHFKAVNDTYGHYTGDAVIQHVSKILIEQSRTNDIVCRFGGEEFVVFLYQAGREQGLQIAERIRATVQNSSVSSAEHTVRVTVSIGGSLKDRLEDINVSIKLADEALYRAKNTGRNRAVVDWMPMPDEQEAKAS